MNYKWEMITFMTGSFVVGIAVGGSPGHLSWWLCTPLFVLFAALTVPKSGIARKAQSKPKP